MENQHKQRHNVDNAQDSPIYSRLFIVCERKLTEDQFQTAFSEFGSIEDIRIPRDYNTGELKGIVFIKFSKTSEAATALEEMNGKVLPDASRPLRVMVAANRSDIQSDDHDEEKYRRLFINVPKVTTEDDIEAHFGEFGCIESVLIQKDRSTGESKGFAYVKYRKFSEAACAFEQCDRKYRAIFASPKGNKRRLETSFESNINSLAMTSKNVQTSFMPMMDVRPRGFTRIHFMCSPYLTQIHVRRLFDIVPGMIDFHFSIDWVSNFAKGMVQYSNPISATYAVEKLNKFEYPPGAKIFVKPDSSQFDHHEQNYSHMPQVINNLKSAITSSANSPAPDLAQLAEAIAEASKLIKMATAGVSDDNIPDSTDLNYCSVKLPPPRPLADIDSAVAKRCFLVCKPQPPPLTVLRDIFCRFGNLINVYTLPNKTVGYARYSTVQSADEAIRKLHGAEICGVRIKVMEAEEEAPAKKLRYDY